MVELETLNLVIKSISECHLVVLLERIEVDLGDFKIEIFESDRIWYYTTG